MVVFGLMCGSELNVAALTHPLLDRQALRLMFVCAAGSRP
jgi:hypothetical protein